MLIRAFIYLLFLSLRVVQFLASVTVVPLVRLFRKKRVLRFLAGVLNDPRIQEETIRSGNAAFLSQACSMISQMRIAEEGDTPLATPEPIEESVLSTDGLCPNYLPPVPKARMIQGVSLGMSLGDFEDWRFATSEALQTSGAMIMITEGCSDWARMATQRGLPPDVVKISFTGGAILSAFQLGLVVHQYWCEQEELRIAQRYRKESS